MSPDPCLAPASCSAETKKRGAVTAATYLPGLSYLPSLAQERVAQLAEVPQLAEQTLR